jgi:bifunctional UDP-N-acetylglucosamine pyrophosphorylase / glucosamine-1-phosphate N-acetyltransferase
MIVSVALGKHFAPRFIKFVRNTFQIFERDHQQMIEIVEYVSSWKDADTGLPDAAPWVVTFAATDIVARMISALDENYSIAGDVAIHQSATVEEGSIIKGPAVIGQACHIAATAYLRGGVWLATGCIVGPACELKTVFMFERSRIAHLSFVGDSIIGSDVNVEAGAIIANYRNERDDKQVLVNVRGRMVPTGRDKFGALVGDGTKIGANAVLAPGTILPRQSIVNRTQLVDQLKI